jgi:hypothetical protein
MERKKFLVAGLSLAAVAAFFSAQHVRPKKKTIKCLTQNGELVEVEENKLSMRRRIATDKEVQHWIFKTLP